MSVTFRNVPAFAVHLDAVVEVPQLGSVTVDVAWGGMFYVIADAEQFGLRITPDEARDIVRIGEMVKLAAQEQLPVRHPENPDLTTGVTIAQISGPAHAPGSTRRNAVIVSTGQASWDRPESWTGAIDRSPCGTGTSAKMACEHARGRLALGPALRPRGDPGHDLHRPAGRPDDGRRLPGGGPHDQRPGLDHRLRPVRRRARRPVPDRLHPDRHLGDAAT